MAAGDTALSICSDALQMLGAKAISSFTEGTDEANVSDSLYPDVKKQTLLVYPWSFVYKKTQISKLLTTPTTEYKYQFQLPGDRIGPPRAVLTSATPGANTIRDYRIFGDKLLTVYMVQLLKYMWAGHLAMPITDQTEKAQYWQGVAIGSPEQNGRGGYTRIAMNMDGQGQPNFVIEDFPLIAVRY
jgi:hypothetical protein